MRYEPVQPVGYDQCHICAGDATGGPAYCSCEFDDHGDVTYDCGRCSDGLFCVECDARFAGLALSIGVFYG